MGKFNISAKIAGLLTDKSEVRAVAAWYDRKFDRIIVYLRSDASRDELAQDFSRPLIS